MPATPNKRQFDDVVAVARFAELEIAQGERSVRDGGDVVGALKSKR